MRRNAIVHGPRFQLCAWCAAQVRCSASNGLCRYSCGLDLNDGITSPHQNAVQQDQLPALSGDGGGIQRGARHRGVAQHGVVAQLHTVCEAVSSRVEIDCSSSSKLQRLDDPACTATVHCKHEMVVGR